MKNKNQKEKKPFRLRFLTIVMLIALLATGGINGFCSYNIFWKGAAAGSAKDNGMTKEQIVLQKEREALKQREKEEQESGRISYTSMGQEKNLEFVIAGESDAYDVLLSIQGDLNISNAQEEYAFSYSRSNEYYDVYTMQQYYDGIEVYGYELKMTADKSGNLLSVDGTHAQLEGFDTTVSLSESDAYDYVEKYLKSEYQVTTDEVSIDGMGKRISFDENNEPVVGYSFEVGEMIFSQQAVMNIFVDGNNGNITKNDMLLYADSGRMSTVTLQGQEGKQTLDVWENEFQALTNDGATAKYECYDVDRNIYIFDANGSKTADIQSVVFNYMDSYTGNNSISDAQIITDAYNITGELSEVAVDALANTQKVYDYYLDTYQRKGNLNCSEPYFIFLNADTGILDHFSTNAYGGMLRMIIPKGKTDAVADFNVVAHEFTHGVTNYEIGGGNFSCAAISEGLSDLFAELAEDYQNDKKYNNNCDWIFSSIRDIKNYKFIKFLNRQELLDDSMLIDAREYAPDGGEVYKYYASTIVTYSAYLMTQGTNNTKALSTEQLGKLYYNSLPNLNTDFKGFRKQIEATALAMNQSIHQVGPLTSVQNDLVKKAGQLTDEQWESVVDSFDRVGIERSYDYSLVPNAEITVTDMNDEAYDNYHLSIVKRNNGNVVVNEDIHSEEYRLPDLEKGLYSFVLTDLNDENLVESFDIIINDNADGQLSARYEETAVIPTKFGSPHKEVVLALDVSGSMDGTPISETKKAALNFVDTVFDANPNTNVSLITYSSSASLILESCNDEAALENAIYGLQSGGDTYMCDAFSTAQRILAEKDVSDKYMIVMGDGLPSDMPVPIASSIREQDVIFCSLGFFHNSSDGISLMKSLASPGYYYNVQDISAIQGLFEEIARQVSGEHYSRSEIACPVDVTVSYHEETLSSAEKIRNLHTSFGSITFEGEDNEVKILRLDEKADYEICINGTGKGTMNYTISFADANGDYSDIRTFEDVPINKKTVISTSSRKARSTMLQVDTNGDGQFDMNYIAGENGKSREYGKVLLLRIAVITGVLFILFLAIEVWLIVKRYRKNKYCAECGSEVNREIKFCPKCGNEIKRVPLIFLEKAERKPQHRAVKIIKLSVIGACIAVTAATLLIYRSAANTVFLQLRNQELTSAALLYHNGVEDSWLSKYYLSFVTDIYLGKVQTAYQNNSLDENSAASVYSTVAEMDMGKASDSAKVYLTNIEQTGQSE